MAAQRLGIAPDKAAEILDETDKMRARYNREYYQRDWNDPVNYHMMLNTETLGMDGRGGGGGGRGRRRWGGSSPASLPEGDPALPVPRIAPLGLEPGVAQLLAPADALLRREALQHQLAGRHGARLVRSGREPHVRHTSTSPGTTLKPLWQSSVRSSPATLSAPPWSNHATILPRSAPPEPLLEHPPGGAADQLARDRVAALQLSLVLQLELAGDRRHRRVDVADPGHDPAPRRA